MGRAYRGSGAGPSDQCRSRPMTRSILEAVMAAAGITGCFLRPDSPHDGPAKRRFF
jgi:hypothetical protein